MVTETYTTLELHQIICFCTFSPDGVTSPLHWELKPVKLIMVCVLVTSYLLNPACDLWTWDLYGWMQQGLKFIGVCKSVVTSLSNMEL